MKFKVESCWTSVYDGWGTRHRRVEVVVADSAATAEDVVRSCLGREARLFQYSGDDAGVDAYFCEVSVQATPL